MKLFLVAMLSLTVGNFANAKTMGQKEYEEEFNVSRGTSEERETVKKCLEHFGKHPFDAKKMKIRVIAPSIKVLGIGKDIEDTTETNYPQFILIKPAVNVLTGTTYQLQNNNGWYCFKANVTVLASSKISAACNAHITGSSDDVTVAGANDDSKGVTVLGKTQVKRFDCDK